ncbi:1,4-alpha-glucan branching protein GlgB [Commensalibacter nepenthis]|uniref:1,4-alpha-glucan branching enzyme GlgB n=1 Tax=Commensalibacter nepenthis TaxID=3043872 RepID=A0ABT6QAB4_9PROT|nr:1,4-alpha-glucan branching protein GlgB [Commensalibacter sp. TBRC 10068]MDI2113837.1 1,4-alpha-glucan branching protein GlgB [Commensalibacter sp. TBRC 10068]
MHNKINDNFNEIIEKVTKGEYNDPFSILGPHLINGYLEFRFFFPHAKQVIILDKTTKKELIILDRIHLDGFFQGKLKRNSYFSYLIKIIWNDSEQVIEDPYRFGKLLTDYDTWLLNNGKDNYSYEKLGAHLITLDGISGVRFIVWAPNAKRVSVIGDFNCWDGRRHPMRLRPESGFWEIFIPDLFKGQLYKYEILTPKNEILFKSDPYSFLNQLRPETASIIYPLPSIQIHTERQRKANQLNQPISIYEVHLGSWMRHSDTNDWLSYKELADKLIPYVKKMGFTHIEILPIQEHPFDGSWGYQPTNLYAPTCRFGNPEDLIYFIDIAHQNQINIILDWVSGHFPKDPFGLEFFDGTSLYEYQDPKEGYHPDWNTLIYNYNSPTICNFLSSNALYWLERFGFDGLRVDAVASMIYRDYSRKHGEWVPNIYGGNINLEAVDFLRHTNDLLHHKYPESALIAEESTSFYGVTLPPKNHGLGFNYKWNMGWMNDTLSYMQLDPIYRKYHHNQMTFGILYAWSENFILPISHDEVVHGKKSLLEKMSGIGDDKFANLRAYYGFMWAYPGKKLIFMGCEFAQYNEWNHNTQLDWYLLEHTDNNLHLGTQILVKDLNFLYRDTPALYADHRRSEGFRWVITDDENNSVYAFIREDQYENFILIISHFSPIFCENYRIGVPQNGVYDIILNTDDFVYGGKNILDNHEILSEPIEKHNFKWSLSLSLPPFSTLYIKLKVISC